MTCIVVASSRDCIYLRENREKQREDRGKKKVGWEFLEQSSKFLGGQISASDKIIEEKHSLRREREREKFNVAQYFLASLMYANPC